MSIDKKLIEPTRLVELIEHELASFFSERRVLVTKYGAQFLRLWDLAADHVLGGKLIRPRLFLEAVTAFDGEVDGSTPMSETAGSIAGAIELLHYAFLLHDDVIDGDFVRRGRSNFIGELREDVLASQSPEGQPAADVSLDWARTGAILMGNLLLAHAHQAFARSDLDRDRRIRLLDLLDMTVVETVAGEQLDVAMSEGIVEGNLQTILEMTRYKTATYTFELPLRAAAVLCAQPEELEVQFADAGARLGLAFQLQDDLLSVFGDAQSHGKRPFADLSTGKQTAIIAYAKMTTAWEHIEPRFGHADLTSAEALEIRSLLRECGAERFVRALVTEQFDAFFEICDSIEVPAARELLRSIAARLRRRSA